MRVLNRQFLMYYEAVVPTNTKKETNFGLWVFIGGLKMNVMLNLQQKRKNALRKIP